MRLPEARFRLNSKDGVVELEGPASFVDKHLEKIENIFNTEMGEILVRRFRMVSNGEAQCCDFPNLLDRSRRSITHTLNSKHNLPRQPSSIPPIPVDLKGNGGKLGLREFYAQKKPSNHYERTAVFAYYLLYHNRQSVVRYGELLSCYEEVGDKKPSIMDIVKNTIRYKGWLEPGPERYTTRLTISGENFVKFDLPSQNIGLIIEQQPGSAMST